MKSKLNIKSEVKALTEKFIERVEKLVVRAAKENGSVNVKKKTKKRKAKKAAE